MSFVVCPLVPFPNILWWSFAIASDQLLLDETEHFEKMSFRNRYMLAGADGLLTLSIPLVNGRQQRRPMNEVRIDNKTNWQTLHWRSIKSLYNRSPYFEFFAPEFEPLFQQKFELLCDFSKAGISLLSKLSGVKNSIIIAENYQQNYPDAKADIRKDFRSNQYNLQPEKFKKYQQTFEERTGFLPNLSMLDLLFSEGKNAKLFLPSQQI